IHTYRERELLHRETVDQITRECVQWEEALAQWRAVFASPLPNPWASAPSNRLLFNLDSVASTNGDSVTTVSGVDGGWLTNVVPDIQDLWHDDRARPVNLCEVSYRLTICEFELRFASCLADLHAYLIAQLLDTQAKVVPSSIDLSPNPILTVSDGRLSSGPHMLPDLLEPRIQVSASNTSKPTSSANSEAAISTSDNPCTIVGWTPFVFLASSSCLVCTLRPSLWYPVVWAGIAFGTVFGILFHVSAHNSLVVVRFGPLLGPGPHLRSVLLFSLCLRDLIHNRCRSPLMPGDIVIPTMSRIGLLLTKYRNDKRLLLVTHDLQIVHRLSRSPSSPTSRSSFSDPCATPMYPTRRPLRRSSVDSTASETVATITREADINKEPWFHGVLPRAEVERLLQNQGDFLVRRTNKRASCREPMLNWHTMASEQKSSTAEASISTFTTTTTTTTTTAGRMPQARDSRPELRMVLSVCWHGHKHFILCGGGPSDDGWFLEDGKFPTIRELLEYHMLSQTPVTAKSGACLTTPIMRPDWELDNKDVQLLQKIGQGNFGEVYRGFYNGSEVAVKTCRADLNAANLRQKFLQGERTALNFCHPHIVKLIGIAVRSYPIMIVMEYVPGGSLLTYLRKSKSTLTVSALLLMASDAASGMAYLESKNCIHRDLAARNCLVTETGRLKIADFGMSREEHIYELSDRRGQIPIKWTAPEALTTGRYTIKCDVWSYGVLLWEIFTFGDVPYRFWSNPQTREMVESGYRLPAPENMPPLICTQMNRCWLADPQSRPTFAELARILHVPTTSDMWTKSGTLSRPPIVVRESDDELSRKMIRTAIAVKDKRTRDI
ncbi:hypothetical protein AHF37_07292, partial [Paragonimus kellicotti]